MMASDVSYRRDAMNQARRLKYFLSSDFIVEHGAEQLPPLPLEPSELHLLDRSEISWTGVDRDARQQVIGSEAL